VASDDRTEAPTYKRRKKAREEGQVARSAELVGTVMLFGLLASLPALAPGLTDRMMGFWTQAVAAASQGEIGPNTLGDLSGRGLMQIGVMAGPIIGVVAAAALVSNVLQVGLHFNAGLLQPRFARLDPAKGLSRLVTGRSAVELGKGLLKLAAVAFVGWKYYDGHRNGFFMLGMTDPAAIAPRVGEFAYQMALRMIATLAVLAALDYAYQRWQLERSLRMTKQEVKDEYREAEGNPEVKARIRQRQREFARRRMMADVPTASVVITNPSHFAVALQYTVGQKGAPKVIAKGQDLLALRIREIAEKSGVPTVENPPLARSLYRTVDVGEEIPAALYRAVAEVLALVWRTSQGVGVPTPGRSGGMGREAS
jgi:flagellar biosynthetic protein FlhB